jgi:hypothetical protein
VKVHKLLEIVWLVLGFLGSWFRSQGDLTLVNLALRQQHREAGNRGQMAHNIESDKVIIIK